jgi:2-(3-amino-3-carboxypropyl)histidine synthase
LYNLELERVIEEIHKLKASRVLLQMPDGMRPFAYQIVKAITLSTDARVFLSADSCYGACDVAIQQAQELEADILVHYGHSEMVKQDEVTILYVHAEVEIDTFALVEAVIPQIANWERVGLVTTIQHIHQIDEIAQELEHRGITVMISESIGKSPIKGQILGCGYSGAERINDRVDGFLYVGGGSFHPKGIIMSTRKSVVIADPFKAEVTKLGEEDMMAVARKRMAAITAVKKAKNIGILVSSKPGQRELEAALELEKKFRDRGVTVVIFYLNEVISEHLNNFIETEGFINTACPRIAIDGINEVHRPILTINEALVALDEKKWENLWGKGYFHP